MPKAPKEIVDRLNSGEDQEEGGSREPVPEGYYLCKALESAEYEGKEHDGVMLKWEVQEPRGHKGHWLWDRFSYNPKAAFKWRQLFEATGYEFDSDTDELVEAEELVIVFVDQQIIPVGKRKGELGNNVVEYFEPNDENRALVDS